MANTITGVIRTIALWMMIATATIADVILYLNGQFIWASFWSIVIALVIVYEIYTYSTKKKTISTVWKEWLINNPKVAWTATILLWIALNSLLIHLIFW